VTYIHISIYLCLGLLTGSLTAVEADIVLVETKDSAVIPAQGIVFVQETQLIRYNRNIIHIHDICGYVHMNCVFL